jgi:hypothetical protein
MSVIPLDQITQTPSQNQITQSLKLMAMWREDMAGWEPVAVLEPAGRPWSFGVEGGAGGIRPWSFGVEGGAVGSGLPLPGSAVGGWDRAATEEQRRERRRNSVERGRGGERARTGGGERFVFFFLSL